LRSLDPQSLIRAGLLQPLQVADDHRDAQLLLGQDRLLQRGHPLQLRSGDLLDEGDRVGPLPLTRRERLVVERERVVDEVADREASARLLLHDLAQPLVGRVVPLPPAAPPLLHLAVGQPQRHAGTPTRMTFAAWMNRGVPSKRSSSTSMSGPFTASLILRETCSTVPFTMTQGSGPKSTAHFERSPARPRGRGDCRVVRAFAVMPAPP